MAAWHIERVPDHATSPAMDDPYSLVAARVPSRRVPKPEVFDACREVEAAGACRGTRLFVATVQDLRFVTPSVREAWTRVAATGAQVLAFGVDLPAYMGPGVTVMGLDEGNPLCRLWATLLLRDDGSARAMVARDAASIEAPDVRQFDLCEFDDPDLVTACIEAMGVPVHRTIV